MRAMTLIKMYFVASLRASTADVSRRISEKVGNLCRSWANPAMFRHTFIKDLSQTAQIHLLYTRLQAFPPHFLLCWAGSNVAQMHTSKNYQPYWWSAILRI
jgi:hypothetical protein